MKLKYGILCIFTFLIFDNLQAQEGSWSVGPQAGIQFSKFYLFPEMAFGDFVDEFNQQSQYSLSTFLGVQFMRHTHTGGIWRSALNFEHKKGLIDEQDLAINNGIQSEGTLKTFNEERYFTLELEKLLRIVSKDTWDFHLGLGPYLSYAIDKQTRMFVDGEVIPSNDNDSIQSKRLELGATILSSLSLDLKDKASLQFMAFAKFPFSHWSLDEEQLGAFRSLGIRVGLNYFL